MRGNSRIEPLDLYSNPYVDEMNQVFACISQNADGQMPPLKYLPELNAVYCQILRPFSGDGGPAAKL